MPQDSKPQLDPNAIVDRLYDIALDPGALETFLDAWNGAGLDTQSARQTIEAIDAFDEKFSTHLKRAETFLNRGEAPGPSLQGMIAPFENLAAMIVDRSLTVLACNAGATSSFKLRDGDTLDKLHASPASQSMLQDALKGLFSSATKPDRLIKLDVGPEEAQTLFQMRRLSEKDPSGNPLALIVTTQYHWQPALGHTLEEVFQLTSAEQGVVRALVEGSDAKKIAAERGTSEATVRSQIKSVLGKMNARSQSEVIRLVLSLRDVAQGNTASAEFAQNMPSDLAVDWLDAECWKPIQTLILPDGRKMDYLDFGPATGAPVLYSHMGYCLVRWTRPMIQLAFQLGLRIICPIRAGYGQSDNLERNADVLESTRADTLFLLSHLGIKRLPYLTQGNDLIFACDLARHHPDIVTEIIGICARPCLPGDQHYASMGKWHRFFLSTAKHAPQLLHFTVKAAMSMTRKIGAFEMFAHVNKDSPADMATVADPNIKRAFVACTDMIAGKSGDITKAYSKEIMRTEANWSDIVMAARATPTHFINGLQDPTMDVASISEYRDHYPWITIDAVPDAGQLLIYQRYEDVLPLAAKAAKEAQQT